MNKVSLWIAFGWLAMAAVVVVVSVYLTAAWPSVLGLSYCAVVLLVSPLAYAMFWWDKAAAQRARRRLPEKTLHLVEFAGGWPGAVVAQQRLRHKSQKGSYRVTLWMIIFSHFALIAGLVWQAA